MKKMLINFTSIALLLFTLYIFFVGMFGDIEVALTFAIPTAIVITILCLIVLREGA